LEGRIREGSVPEETKGLFTLGGSFKDLTEESEERRGVKAPIFELQGLYT